MTDNEQLQALAEVGRELSQISDLDELLHHAVRSAQALTGATYTSAGLVEGSFIHWRSAAGKPLEEVQGYRMPVSEGLCGWVVRNGASRRTGDVTQESDYFQQYAEMRSELDVPIKVGERVIGVLSAESPEVNAFTAVHETTMEILAGYLALAVLAALDSLLPRGDLVE